MSVVASMPSTALAELPVPEVESREVVASGAQAGLVAHDADGLPVLAMMEVDLAGPSPAVLLLCRDPACRDRERVQVGKGRVTAFAIGGDGLPLVGYQAVPGPILTLAHCLDADCSASETVVFRDAMDQGVIAGINLGMDGMPVLAYIEGGETIGRTDLRIGVCHDVACEGVVEHFVVDDDADWVGPVSVQVSEGRLYLLYRVRSGPSVELRFAHCSDVRCSGGIEKRTIVAGSFEPSGHSLRVSSQGLPILAYEVIAGAGPSSEVHAAFCADATCAQIDSVVLGTFENLGLDPQIELLVDGSPLIAISYEEGLRLIRCSDAICSSHTAFDVTSGLTSTATGIDIGTSPAGQVGVLWGHSWNLLEFLTLRASGAFADDDGSIFEADIEWLAAAGITRGCNPPENTRYCVDDPVLRSEIAAFLVRALGLTDSGGGDLFTDDDGSIFEADIDRLGAAGITRGCDPPDNTRFCPDRRVTRAEMAALLVRTLGLTDDGGGDLFTDDDGSIFEADIDRLGAAGTTRGCNPPANDQFCPSSFVTRGQMAAFLHRALG